MLLVVPMGARNRGCCDLRTTTRVRYPVSKAVVRSWSASHHQRVMEDARAEGVMEDARAEV